MITKTLWRVFAIIILLVWIIVFLGYNSFASTVSSSHYLSFDNNVFYLISILISIILVFFPTKFILYSIMCCFWGLMHLLDDAGTNGFIMYALGLAFSYKATILFRRKILTFMFFFPPVLMIGYQYNLGGAGQVVITVIELMFLLLVASLSMLLFNESFFTKLTMKGKGAVDLSVLKTTELEVLKEVLANKTYSTIGNERNKSESSIKLVMQDVYAKLKLKGKKELMELYERKLLVLPE